MRISDWSSDVCSSDLARLRGGDGQAGIVEVLGPRGGPVHALLLQDRHVRVLEVLVGDADGPAGLLRGEEDVIVGGRVLVVGGALAHAGDLDARGTRDVTGVGGHRVGARRSEEHTSELQSLMRISYAVFCLKKKKHQKTNH